MTPTHQLQVYSDHEIDDKLNIVVVIIIIIIIIDIHIYSPLEIVLFKTQSNTKYERFSFQIGIRIIVCHCMRD